MGRRLLHLFGWLFLLFAALLLLLIGSIVVDGWLGSTRVDLLTNNRIESPTGPPVQAYVAHPQQSGRSPAVIMIHEFWGLNPSLLGKAQALAREGYVVVAPDTFRGSSTAWFPRALYQSISTPVERVNQDLDAVLTWLRQQPDVDPTRIAIMGFCYGGGKALRYSLHNPELAATVVFYGSPVTEAPLLRRLQGPVLGIFGTADRQIPVSQVQAFELALAAAGVPHRISYYQDQPHAFVTDVAAIRRGGAQGPAWQEMLDFLAAALRR